MEFCSSGSQSMAQWALINNAFSRSGRGENDEYSANQSKPSSHAVRLPPVAPGDRPPVSGTCSGLKQNIAAKNRYNSC